MESVPPLGCCSADDDKIAQDTVAVRKLIQEKEAEQGRKENLRVVEYGQILGGSAGISPRNTKLSYGSGTSS